MFSAFPSQALEQPDEIAALTFRQNRTKMVLTRRLFVAFLICLAPGAFCQRSAVLRVGVAAVVGGTKEVSAVDVQAQLVKLLNEAKPDKKASASIEATALKQSRRSEAIAEGGSSACQFVLLINIDEEDLAHSGRFGTSPKKSFRAVYELARVDTGTNYAAGLVQEKVSNSPQSAAESAEKRLVREVAMDLSGEGAIAIARDKVPAALQATPPVKDKDEVQAPSPEGKSAALDKQAETDVPVPADKPQSAPQFCTWIVGEIPHSQALEGICEFAVSLKSRMPNFICDETTTRFREGVFSPLDSISGTLRYEDTRESFSDVKVNGKKAPPEVVNQLSGLWSSGEFGVNLRAVFDSTNSPVFTFAEEKKLGTVEDKKRGTRTAWVFHFRIAEQRAPRWWVTSDDQRLAPPYNGDIWVDQKTGELALLHLTAEGLPKKFTTQSVDTFTLYGKVSFDDGTNFVLPSESEVRTKYHGVVTINVLQFKNCHKFRAKSRMLLEVPTPANPPK